MRSGCVRGGQQAMGSRGALAPVPLARPFTSRAPSNYAFHSLRRQSLVVRSSGEDGNVEQQQQQQGGAAKRRRQRKQKEPETFSLDKLNPIAMGRKSREVFDDVWFQLQRLGSASRGLVLGDYSMEIGGEFEAPQAPDTLVLVAGATGRVGRVLVRKLLLRGYKVRALVRGKEGVEDSLPQSVQLVYGDLADYAACRKAVEGVDKVVCCAAARTTLTAELTRVEQQGVVNLCKALLDSRNAAARRAKSAEHVGKYEVVDFKKEVYHEHWDIEKVVPEMEGVTRRRVFDRGQDRAEAFINEEDNLVFTGAVYSRGGIAQVGSKLVCPYEDKLQRPLLQGTEGLLLEFKGDGNTYTMQLSTEEGHTYASKFTAAAGFNHARLPFEGFLPLVNSAPRLDPASVKHMSIRYEPRQTSQSVVTSIPDIKATPFDQSAKSFRLELDWIKALPGGVETDFVLVSCAGRRPDLGEASRQKLATYKARGEDAVRNSGLGYTIVRPGPLKEEAGGYKALVFDQGNRVRQSISCADVADVCLKALHDPLARNKTFEVCWEYTSPAGLEQYELVAHLPDKSNNYLSPAMASLRRNT